MHRTIPLTLLLVPLSCIVMSLRSLSLILLGLVRAVSSKLPKVVLTCFLIMMVNSWIVVFRLHISNWSLLLMMMKSLMLLVRFSTIVALVIISNILLLGKAMMTLAILGFLLLTLMIFTLSFLDILSFIFRFLIFYFISFLFLASQSSILLPCFTLFFSFHIFSHFHIFTYSHIHIFTFSCFFPEKVF